MTVAERRVAVRHAVSGYRPTVGVRTTPNPRPAIATPEQSHPHSPPFPTPRKTPKHYHILLFYVPFSNCMGFGVRKRVDEGQGGELVRAQHRQRSNLFSSWLQYLAGIKPIPSLGFLPVIFNIFPSSLFLPIYGQTKATILFSTLNRSGNRVQFLPQTNFMFIQDLNQMRICNYGVFQSRFKKMCSPACKLIRK